MEQLNTLDDLFVMEMKDAYSAERQVSEVVPKLIEAASSPELRQKFEQYSAVNQQQIARLEDVFDILDIEPEAEKCEGMEGIIDDLEDIIKAKGEGHVKDAALIAGFQKVDHYEIATYGTLRTFAQTLGWDDVADKLQETLNVERQTDRLLSEFAMSSVNVMAPHA